jgi:endonuclease YncB( thermonuclease family)
MSEDLPPPITIRDVAQAFIDLNSGKFFGNTGAVNMSELPAPAPVPAAVFNAQFIKAYDGDTPTMLIDKHHGDRSIKVIRLLGVNCPELTGASKAAGQQARLFAMQWFDKGVQYAFDSTWQFVVEGEHTDKYGRLLANIYRKIDGANLVNDLISSGHGERYMVSKQLHSLGAINLTDFDIGWQPTSAGRYPPSNPRGG